MRTGTCLTSVFPSPFVSSQATPMNRANSSKYLAFVHFQNNFMLLQLVLSVASPRIRWEMCVLLSSQEEETEVKRPSQPVR